MTECTRWLAVRSLRQYLVVACLTGLCATVLGDVIAPVPGQLFADVSGIPLVYLSPLVMAVSLAQWAPAGTYWIDERADASRTALVVVAGYMLAFAPPLLTSSATSLCMISARNGLMLCGATLSLRPRATAAATTAAVLIPNVFVWTFGWSDQDQPRSWALLLLPAAEPAAGAVTVAFLLLGLSSHRRVRDPQ